MDQETYGTARLRERLTELLLDLAALLWPTECAGCGAADRDCCRRCLAALRAPPAVLERDLGTACFAAGRYEGVLAALLVGFKHGGRVRFARPLGDRLRAPLLAGLAECSGPSPPVVVAMPSRPARVRERGYRHVDVLVARALRPARRMGPRAPGRPGTPVNPVESGGAASREPAPGRAARVLPERSGARVAALRLPALRTLRGRRGQVGLDPAGRARNAALIAVRRSASRVLRGREVVLVDDVITTGASALAARESLENAGARVVAIVALGLVERRDTRGQAGVATRSPGGVECRKGVTVRRTGPPA